MSIYILILTTDATIYEMPYMPHRLYINDSIKVHIHTYALRLCGDFCYSICVPMLGYYVEFPRKIDNKIYFNFYAFANMPTLYTGLSKWKTFMKTMQYYCVHSLFFVKQIISHKLPVRIREERKDEKSSNVTYSSPQNLHYVKKFIVYGFYITRKTFFKFKPIRYYINDSQFKIRKLKEIFSAFPFFIIFITNILYKN